MISHVKYLSDIFRRYRNMHSLILFWLISLVLKVECFRSLVKRFDYKRLPSYNDPSYKATYLKSVKQTTVETPALVGVNLEEPVDLSGFALTLEYSGFIGLINMTFTMELLPNNKVKYSRGLTADGEGFWRTLKLTDGSKNQLFEATHPLLPEHQFVLNIWETSILWRGVIDVNSSSIISGEVITNKKSFGLFPYTEVIATFTGKIYSPSMKLPDYPIRASHPYTFVPPPDYYGPLDMKRYPQIFDKEFVDWFLAVEDALSKGETPPPKPKPFFIPQADTVEEETTSGKSFRSRNNVQRGLVGEIISRFEKKGFKLAALKLFQPTRSLLEVHYQDLASKSFFGGLVEYMVSGPVCCMVWEGAGAVKSGRVLLGATKPSESAPGTIRGDFAIDVGRNICHGSDSVESAEREIALWFPEGVTTWESHSAAWIYESK